MEAAYLVQHIGQRLRNGKNKQIRICLFGKCGLIHCNTMCCGGKISGAWAGFRRFTAYRARFWYNKYFFVTLHPRSGISAVRRRMAHSAIVFGRGRTAYIFIFIESETRKDSIFCTGDGDGISLVFVCQHWPPRRRSARLDTSGVRKQ